MRPINPFFLTDGYKTGHHLMYPEGTTLVYTNGTCRSAKYAPEGINKVVVFGSQLTVRFLDETFKEGFFDQPKEVVCEEVRKEYSMYLGQEYDVSHVEALHDLQYLPIEYKSLKEGSLCPIGVPMVTIKNTLPKFYWLTNFLETIISNIAWKPYTSATIAKKYKDVLVEWAMKTDKENIAFVDWQGHDFSMRGMDSPFASMSSALGHATSFSGSDSLIAIYGARKYYLEKEFVVGSVNATEHSVMCAGGKEDEVETFRRLLKTFPTGILSVVSDTWDLWHVITNILPQLKDEIMARDGKLVIRPDSGDPVDIVCGTGKMVNRPEHIGVIELLWDEFGGTTNDQGFKVLDSHIGCIYGDSITLERAEAICQRLSDKGFASTNVVLGIGSFTYQFNTRDTFGFAMKATYTEIKGECVEFAEKEGSLGHPSNTCLNCSCVRGIEIFKDPVTDDGMKKSAKGLLRVDLEDGEYVLKQGVTWKEEAGGELQTIFKNGVFMNQVSLMEIRQTLANV